MHVCVPSPVAQEFGVSQADLAMSSSQQPQQASSTIHILSLLLRLRQCCCHLSLLKKVVTCSNMLNSPSTQTKATWKVHASVDFILSPLRLLTRRSFRVMGSSCLWRSSSTLCLSLPVPRRQALTPKQLWPSMAPASPPSSLRTPVRAPR